MGFRKRRRGRWRGKKARALPVMTWEGGWRLAAWSCHAEHRGNRCAGADLGNGVHTRERDRQGGHDGKVCRVEVHRGLGNLSPEFCLADSGIWSGAVSASWCTNGRTKLSGSYARLRWRRRCRIGIKRRPELTANRRCP
jgi:hypothetical protein